MRNFTKFTFFLGTLVVAPAMFLPSVIYNHHHCQNRQNLTFIQSLSLKSTRHFSYVPSVSSPNIRGITETNSYLWVGTDQGLYKSTDSEKSFNKVNSWEVRTIVQDTNATLWVGTANAGFYKSTDGGVNFVHVNGWLVQAVVQDGNGTLWVGAVHGLYKSTDGGVNFVQVNNWDVSTVYQDANGTLWVGRNVENAFYKSTDGGVNFVQVNNWSVNTVYQDANGTLWVGAEHGLYKSTDGGGHFVNVNNWNVKKVYQDANATLWVGTVIAGFYKSTDGGGHFVKVNGWVVSTVVQDTNSTLWVGTLTDGLWEFDYGYGVHFTEGSKYTNSYLDTHETIVSNKAMGFWTNDPAITRIFINGTEYDEGVKLFNYQMTNGKYQIAIDYTAASKIPPVQLYYWVKKSFVVNTNDFTTDTTYYTIKEYHGYINHDPNRGVDVVAVLNPHQVGQAVLKIQPSDPLFNPKASFYQSVNTQTFQPTGPKTTLGTDETTINHDGLYLLTLADVLGNTAIRYLQVGGTKLIISPEAIVPATKINPAAIVPATKINPAAIVPATKINPAGAIIHPAAIVPATKINPAAIVPATKINPAIQVAPHKYMPWWVITLIVVGSVVGLGAIVWVIIRFATRTR